MSVEDFAPEEAAKEERIAVEVDDAGRSEEYHERELPEELAVEVSEELAASVEQDDPVLLQRSWPNGSAGL